MELVVLLVLAGIILVLFMAPIGAILIGLAAGDWACDQLSGKKDKEDV